MSNQPGRTEQIVRTALELNPEDREAFLDDACGEDANLRRSVETWLRIRTGSPATVSLPPTPAVSSPPRTVPSPTPPSESAASGGGNLLLMVVGGLFLVAVGFAAHFANQARLEAERADRAEQRVGMQSQDLLFQQSLLGVRDLQSRQVLEFLARDLLTPDANLEALGEKVPQVANGNMEVLSFLREALGTVYLSRGDGKNALEQFQRAAGKQPSPALKARMDQARQVQVQTALPQLRARIDELQKQEKFVEAEPLLREVVTLLRENVGDPLDRAIQEVLLGRNLLAQGKYVEAEPFLRAALGEIEKQRAEQWPRFDTQSLLGASLLGQKRHQEAEVLLLAGYEGLKQRQEQIPQAAQSRIQEAGLRIVALYESWDRKSEAESWRRKIGM